MNVGGTKHPDGPQIEASSLRSRSAALLLCFAIVFAIFRAEILVGIFKIFLLTDRHLVKDLVEDFISIEF